MSRDNEKIVVAIDIGTTKICVLIARESYPGNLEIMGIGKAPSHGLKRGVVVDVAQTIVSIRSAIGQAEKMAEVRVENACVGISGSHIYAINSSGVVPIKSGRVKPQDIQNALASAQAVPISEGNQILHVLPHYFIIDGREKIIDPLDMHGIRLEVQAHIIMGAVSSVRNLITCCQMADIEVSDVILEQLASADAVLTQDEKDLGVGVLDIGGGTADFAVYQQGAIRHTKVFPIAGMHFTRDLAIGLRTTIALAEKIKTEYGCVYDQSGTRASKPMNKEYGDISHEDIIHVLQPRAEELMKFLVDEVQSKDLRPFMTMGLVLTGGGSLLYGIDALAGKLLNMPVRVGYPEEIHHLPEIIQSPIYATSYGLLAHMGKKRLSLHMNCDPLHTRIFERMKSWISDLF